MIETLGDYAIECYPGQTRIIELLKTDQTIYALPTGTTATAKIVNVLNEVVAELITAIPQPELGQVRLQLPDSALIRRYSGRSLYWDMILQIPGAKKFLPMSSFSVLRSPTQSGVAMGLPSVGLAGGGGTTTTTTTTPAPSLSSLYVLDQLWVDNQGKRVRVTIEKQPNGAQYFKLTEVL